VRCLESARDILEKLHQANPLTVSYASELSDVHRLMGMAYGKHGKTSEGEECFGKALALMHKVIEAQPDDPEHVNDLAKCHFDLGVIGSQAKRLEDALRSFAQARDLREKVVRDHPENVVYRQDLALTWDNYGGILWNLGRRPHANGPGSTSRPTWPPLRVSCPIAGC
jgi:tetratricopeptide (TPR) repeat protein